MGKHRPAATTTPRFAADFYPAAVPVSHRLHRSGPSRPVIGATLAAATLTLVPLGAAPALASVPQPTAPATTAPASVLATSGGYTVVRGDTLSKIGAAQGVAWRSIAAANGIAAPYTITIGQKLTIPGTSTAPAPAPAPAPAAEPQVEAFSVPEVAAPAATGAASTAVSFALAQVGDAYVWKGNGPDAWDCSGLTSAAWAAAGVSLPRTSNAQAGAGTATTRANLVPGDLVAYYSPVSHVALYIGNGQVVQAANESTGVQVNSIDWAGAPTAYRHIG